MTDNYLLAAKAQLDRDLVPGHPLRRVVDELIEAIKDRDEAIKDRDEARELARRMDQNALGWICGEQFDAELNSIGWLKEIR